jgi:hypothetical protein
MRFAIQLVTETDGPNQEVREIASIDRPNAQLRIEELGLTLAEARTLLTALQIRITDAQIRGFTRHERPCPCCRQLRQRKDHRTITVRTCLGKLKLPGTGTFDERFAWSRRSMTGWICSTGYARRVTRRDAQAEIIPR